MAAAEVKPTVKGLNRTEALASIMQDPVWDVVVVGGGATGAGVALDAASRGLKTLLLEAQDFSAGTSSRSTKLIHGGVRYLKNPRDWGLVHDALVERKRLIDNCPQLVHAEPFVLPCFKKWEREIYMAGLGFYGAMAGKDQIGRTRMLKPEEAEKVLPGVKTEGLLGGVEFFDAQFDDARLNIALIRTAATHGAVCLNYMPVVGLERIGGLIQSVTVEDKHTGESHRIRTKMVFNCAGVWADQIRRLADPQAAQLLRFSRGTHVVVDRSFLPGDAGMLIPKTRDGRVLFAIPWHNAVLLGTTDVEVRRRRDCLYSRDGFWVSGKASLSQRRACCFCWSASASAGASRSILNRSGFAKPFRHFGIRQYDHDCRRQVDVVPSNGRGCHARGDAASSY